MFCLMKEGRSKDGCKLIFDVTQLKDVTETTALVHAQNNLYIGSDKSFEEENHP